MKTIITISAETFDGIIKDRRRGLFFIQLGGIEAQVRVLNNERQCTHDFKSLDEFAEVVGKMAAA